MLSTLGPPPSLYIRICRKLVGWEFPKTWPTAPKEILTQANKTTSEILPYIHAVSAMCSGKMGFKRDIVEDISFNYLVKTENLKNKFMGWITTIPYNPADPAFFATYKVETNRLASVFQFNKEYILNQFPIHRKTEYLMILRLLCIYFGSPWSSVQKREISSKQVYALCVPSSMVNYGL